MTQITTSPITHNHAYGPDCAEMDAEREAHAGCVPAICYVGTDSQECRYQRQAGRSAQAESPVAADGAHISMPAVRATYQTISALERFAVITKIAEIAVMQERGYNQKRGCCFFEICPRDRRGFAEALVALVSYATKGGAS